MTTTSQLESIFFAALEKPLADRAGFLDEACRNDAELRDRLAHMISAQVDAGSFLEGRAFDGGDTVLYESPIAEGPGTLIGPYKLLQQIGEGGMGVVFMAEQTEPIQRTVALKIIKPGMDSKQVIARFEAERQALALMDHPNIARVLDAGMTESDRPYFVMDLVKGVPITEYCDQQHLSIRERLKLMTLVCQAIQHAHQKGIIHRDIKPSNVLVAEYDGKPVPKVIDFGVAKATAQKLTEKTMFTEYGQLIGTFEYMSPEQARFNQLDIDTRSDIYSLGVLLYELLAGSTPLQKERLRSAAFDEILRIIREEEAPAPSTRLGSSEFLPSISTQRHSEPAKLTRMVRGELDWIVLKCLEKDRNRRYETATEFATDLRHYLNEEAVEACRPSTAYRMKKFIYRNKVGVVASSAVAAAIVLGLVLAIAGFIQAKRQAELASTEAQRSTRTLRFLQQMLTSINPDAKGAADVTVHQVLDRAADKIDVAFADQPVVRINLHELIGQAYYGLVLYEQAMPHLQMAVDLRERHLPGEKLALADTLLRLAQAYSWDRNKHALALAMSREALALYETQIPDTDERVIVASSLESQLAIPAGTAMPFNPDVWAARVLPTVLGLTEAQIARLPQVWGDAISEAQVLNQAGDVAGAKAALDHGHEMLLSDLRSLGSAGDISAARQLIRRSYSPWMEVPLLRTIMPIVLISEAWEVRRDDLNLVVAEVILHEAVAAAHEVWGQDHQYIARALNDLAIVLHQQGKFGEAEQRAREALAMRRKLLGMDDPETIATVQSLIVVLSAAGKELEAESLRLEFGISYESPQTQQESN